MTAIEHGVFSRQQQAPRPDYHTNTLAQPPPPPLRHNGRSGWHLTRRRYVGQNFLRSRYLQCHSPHHMAHLDVRRHYETLCFFLGGVLNKTMTKRARTSGGHKSWDDLFVDKTRMRRIFHLGLSANLSFESTAFELMHRYVEHETRATVKAALRLETRVGKRSTASKESMEEATRWRNADIFNTRGKGGHSGVLDTKLYQEKNKTLKGDLIAIAQIKNLIDAVLPGTGVTRKTTGFVHQTGVFVLRMANKLMSRTLAHMAVEGRSRVSVGDVRRAANDMHLSYAGPLIVQREKPPRVPGTPSL